MSAHSTSHKSLSRWLLAGASALALSSGAIAQEAKEIGIPDSEYSLEALIEAAKLEAPITVIDATGKIVSMAENFTAKYGVEATGVKMSGQEQEQVLLREAAAGNVRTDVFNMSNLPSVSSQILPQGVGISWMPPDLLEVIPVHYQAPAITSLNPWMWSYNTLHGETCPIDNMWALTTEEWKSRVAIPDPLLRNETNFWFNQIETHDDDAMRQAYEDYFGEPLVTEEASATAEWVKRFAQNKPSVTRSDTDVGPIVGAPGQEAPFMGFLSASIFRDAAKDGYGMGICAGMKPWVGQLTPRVAVIAAGTQSPTAAKLFAHFIMTEEGMGPQLSDGKISTNIEAKMPENEASGVFKLIDQFHVNHSESTASDFEHLQDWQDF